MSVFRLPRMLTLLAWEMAFDPRRGPLSPNGAWLSPIVERGLQLDFTQVEFADFGALANALLLLDAAVRDGIRATVTLPCEALTPGERRHVGNLRRASDMAAEDACRQIARRARARGEARAFMEQTGFLDALRAPHWRHSGVAVQEAKMTLVDDRLDEPSAGTQESDPAAAPRRARRVFRFQWLEPLRGDRWLESESFRTVFTGLRDLGISASDARALSQTVLAELVENVAEHAGVDGTGPPFALVGAVLLNAEAYAQRADAMPTALAELAECATTSGSQVLRLIVGDSGSDLVSRLAPFQARNGHSADAGLTAGDRAKTAETTIFYAFDKWSTSRAGSATGRPRTRGLWRVARMVRSYRGGVLVRTADAMAGLVYGKKDEAIKISEGRLGRLGRVAGMLLDIHLLTDPRRGPVSAGWASHPAVNRPARLRWARCAFHPHHGRSVSSWSALNQVARAPRRYRPATGVIATAPARDPATHWTSDAIKNSIHEVLNTADMVNSPPAVVIFPDADPRIVDLALSGFNEEQRAAARPDDGRAGPCNPVLVLGAHGGPFWCGGSAPLRAVLDTLSAAGGVSPADEARRRWLGSGGTAAGLQDALRRHDYLLDAGEGLIGLPLSPQSVLASLEQTADRQLANAIRHGGSGVESGRFRGPALRITKRWIDVEQLLIGTVGFDVAAFILARKVEAELGLSPQPGMPAVAVQVASAPRPLVRHFSECLSLGGRYYPVPADLDIGDVPVGERVPAGAGAILCADLISTENTVCRAAATIAGGNADPLVIACVVDAREEHGPIRLLNRDIPVVSLTIADIAFGKDEGTGTGAVTDIDPILLRPHVPAQPAMDEVPEADLLNWCAAEPDALRLGHIDWPPHRHFSAFIRLDRVLRQHEIRNRITDAVLATAQDAYTDLGRQDLFAANTGVRLWYVESRDGDAQRIATAVHERLIARGNRAGTLVPVRRAVAGDGWAFPAVVDGSPRQAAVLIIGWSAVTGTTLLQLIRLAAGSGAHTVVAVSVLNRLGLQDAEALRMLRAVSVPGHPESATGPATQAPITSTARCIPAAVRFVTASSITALPAHDCAICAASERYKVTDETLRRLRQHADRLYEMLRPRGQEDVSSESATDLFGVPVGNQDVVGYLRWRRLLLRALRDLRARQEVIDRLRMLAEGQLSGWTNLALIRLLSAEQQWLKLPPLRFAVARDLLAEICVAAVERSVTIPPWLRVQALMVLSMTVPDRMAALLPKLLPVAAEESVLVDQMLLDCYRLLRRPPRDSPVDVVQLRRSLIRCREYLEKLDDREGWSRTDDHLHVIGQLITIADDRILPKPADAQAAWDRLRERLMRAVVRHRLETDLLLVRGFVEYLADVEPTRESVRAARANWDRCARHLAERALVDLPALRDILAGEYICDWLGDKEQHRLLGLAQAGFAGLHAVTDRLHRLTHEPRRPGYPPWEALRRELLDRLNWWNRVFLAAHVEDSEVPAKLVELLDSAPVMLAPQVADVFMACGVTSATVDRSDLGDVSVFCPRGLLDQVIRHLLENVRRHRMPGAACRLQLGYERPSTDSVRLVLRNSGTVVRTPPGQGLRALSKKLQPFGGALTGHPCSNDEWTFGAVLTLPVWRQGE